MDKLHYLMFNIFLNFAIILISILLLRILSTKKKDNSFTEKALIGILFAIGTLISMHYPLKMESGVIIDSRTVFINLATILFGEVAGFITTISSIIYRVYLGGAGETGGILLVICAYLISLFFYYNSQKKGEITLRHLFETSLATHITMVALILIFLSEFFQTPSGKLILFSIITVYPITTTLLGAIIMESQKWENLKKETEIQKSYFNTLLNNISEIVISADTDGKITFANKTAKDFFRNKKLNGLDLFQVIKIYDHNENLITDILLDKAQKGESVILKNHFVKKGIHLIPIEGSISPLTQHGNMPIGVLVCFTDIKDKVEKEKLLSEILERISDGIESLDKKWNYTFANKQAAKLLNKNSPEELIGKNKWKLDPEVIGTPFYEACMEAQKTQKPIFMEHHYKPWNKWFENRIYPSKEGTTIFFTDITEKKKLEEEIKKMNEKLNTIFKLNSAVIFIWDLEKKETIFVSENIENILGYTKEEAMGEKWWRNIVHPEDYQQSLSNSDLVYIDKFSNQKFRVFKKDGTLAWIFEKQVMVEDKEKNKRLVYGIWVDITELVEIEEKLKEQREAFYHLFENEFVPMLLIDPNDFKIIDANKAACRLYGYSKKDFCERLNVEDLHFEPINPSNMKQGKEPKMFFETSHKKANGETIYVEIYGIPFVQNGKEYVFAIIHDITDKKNMEDDLIVSESKLFLVFQSSPIATAISSLSNGKFIDVNPAFEKISGFTKNELLGKTSLDLNLWDKPEERAFFIEKLKKEKVIINEKITFRNKQGKKIYTLFTAFILENDLMFSYVIDITKLIKLQSELEIKVRERTKKLEELNEELQEFTQSIVHDLKEPVRTIKNLSELILNSKDIGKKSELDYLKLINSASHLIEEMINELYEYTKLKRETFTLSKVSLDNVINNVLTMLDLKIKETKAKITIENEFGMVYGNNTLLTKVFINILENAIKFSKKDKTPEIKISSKKTRSKITVKITDNGIGIRKEDLNKIFYPFVKVHKDSKIEGIGMGLSIVKKSMELMGGKIEIKSKLNQGTQVFLIFKL